MALTIIARTSKKNRTRYLATVRVYGVKTVNRTFDTREDAECFGKRVEAQMKKAAANLRAANEADAARRLREPALSSYSDQKISVVLDLFRKSLRCSMHDQKTAAGLSKSIGNVTVGELHELDDAWTEAYILRKRDDAGGKKPTTYATIEGHMQVIKRALRWSAKQFKVAPVALHFSVLEHFPKDWENQRNRRLTAEEERMIRDHFCKSGDPAREWWLLLLDLALETGARLQEMILAERQEFNVEDRVWNMPASHTKKKTARFVVLTMHAQATVARLFELAKPGESRLFHVIRGSKSASSKLSRVYRKIGIVGFRTHDLRHEAISRMVSNHRDVQVFELMQMVGHKKTEMLARYSHGRADEIAKRMR